MVKSANRQCAVVVGGLRGVQLRCWRQFLRGAALPGWPVVGRGDKAVRAAGRLELLHPAGHQHPLLLARARVQGAHGRQHLHSLHQGSKHQHRGWKYEGYCKIMQSEK